jgi:hypothetical protein
VERIEKAPGHGGGSVRETYPAKALRASSAELRQIDHRHTHLPERSVLHSLGERPGER